VYAEAVCLRGRVEYWQGDFVFVPCDVNCWSGFCWIVRIEGLGISELQALGWDGTGQVLDFYGEYMNGSMAADCEFILTRIEEHDGDCGPVPNHAMTWGDIKATYR